MLDLKKHYYVVTRIQVIDWPLEQVDLDEMDYWNIGYFEGQINKEEIGDISSYMRTWAYHIDNQKALNADARALRRTCLPCVDTDIGQVENYPDEFDWVVEEEMGLSPPLGLYDETRKALDKRGVEERYQELVRDFTKKDHQPLPLRFLDRTVYPKKLDLL